MKYRNLIIAFIVLLAFSILHVSTEDAPKDAEKEKKETESEQEVIPPEGHTNKTETKKASNIKAYEWIGWNTSILSKNYLYHTDEKYMWFRDYSKAELVYNEIQDGKTMNLTCLFCNKELGFIYDKEKPFEEKMQIPISMIKPVDNELPRNY